MKTLVRRHVAPALTVALTDTPIVVIQGARQVGKSTLLAENLAHIRSRHISLDDPVAHAAAVADPTTFVNQLEDGCLGIDEVQRAPSLIVAIKASVDTNRRPGRFLLTGSADLLRIPTAHESLAGRAETIELGGFSQGEIENHVETFVDRAFSGDLGLEPSALTRADYLGRACAGGYPEAVQRSHVRRRVWFDEYLRRITERDAPDVTSLHHLEALPDLLTLIAASSASPIADASLAKGLGSLDASRIPAYVALLETLHLVQRVRAWSNAPSKRVTRRRKLALLDTGLMARLTNMSAAALAAEVNPTLAGPLLETFVLAELRKQIRWSDTRPAMFHHRDRDGAEVDVILESPDGYVVGIEVKASATATERDFRWIRQLRDRLGHRFAAGIVLYTGQAAHSFGDRLTLLPMSALWRL